MKLAEVYTSNNPRLPGHSARDTFELSDLTSGVDEDVLLHIIKDRNFLPTFFGSRLMVVVSNSKVVAAQQAYIEQEYGVKGKDMTNDLVTVFHYNPSDKHIYVKARYLYKDIVDDRDPRYKEMYVSFKVGKGNEVKIIDPEEANKVANSPDAISIFKIAPGMEFL